MQVLDSERVEARLSGIEHQLAALDRRLAALEGTAPGPDERLPVDVPEAERPLAPAIGAVTILTLAGRTFVILAGAYLLRAVTESGAVPQALGVGLGLAYACVWLAVADRAALRSRLSAVFYGACAAIVGLPLVWEAAMRFGAITPEAAAAVVAGLTALMIAVAWHRRLESLAWAGVLGALGTGGALLFATQAVLPFACLFVALGVATLWLGYECDWVGPRWPAALAADAVVLGMAGRALTTPPRDAPEVVLAVQVAFLASYLASIAIRTLVRGRDVIPFELAQTSAMLVTGLGGAMVVADQTATAKGGLGVTVIVMGTILYAVAFAFVDRRHGRRVNFYFYTSLALVFVLAGSALVIKGALLGLVWAALAILTGLAARQYGRLALAIHAVLYVGAAAVSTGLMAAALGALFAPADSPVPIVDGADWAVLIALGLVNLLTLRRSEQTSVPVRIPGWLLATLTALLVGGAGTIAAMPYFAPGETSARAAVLATVRTAVTAVAAIAVAWLGRRGATRAFGLLLYPLLAWGALKLVIEDFRWSPPSMLFVALALYGAALILAPRLRATANEG